MGAICAAILMYYGYQNMGFRGVGLNPPPPTRADPYQPNCNAPAPSGEYSVVLICLSGAVS